MKNAILATLLSVCAAIAQPFNFYAAPLNGSSSSANCDSACQTLFGDGEGILYKGGQDSTIVSIPNGAVGQILQSRGSGLRPEFTNPAAIQAFVYGPGDSLVSNPVLVNQNAKFIRVTDTAYPGGDWADSISSLTMGGYTAYMQATIAPVIGLTARTTGTGQSIRKVLWNGAMFAAVGDSGIIRTSTDGTTWTTRTSPTTSNLRDMIWTGSGGAFIAVSSTGQIVVSTDGLTWSVSNTISGNPSLRGIARTGAIYMVVGESNACYYAKNTITTWTQCTPGFTGTGLISDVAYFNSMFIIVGIGGQIKTSTDTGLTWTSRTSGTIELLNQVEVIKGSLWIPAGDGRLLTSSNGTSYSVQPSLASVNMTSIFWINGYYYLCGTSGSFYRSTTGATGTWTSMTQGAISWRSLAANAGILVVSGDGGNLRSAATGYIINSYPSEADRTAGTGSTANDTIHYTSQPAAATLGPVSFTITGVDSTDLPLDFEAVRGFKSTAYASTADRSGLTNPLGSAADPYTSTPLVVMIPSQITFNIGVLDTLDVPFNFDVVTIADVIYNLFVVQNSALDPGPYYGFNAVYDFGVDDRFEYGAESNNEWATLMIQNSTTGEWFVKKSSVAGNAGDPITWVDAFVINADGTVRIVSLTGTGIRSVCADSDGELMECP